MRYRILGPLELLDDNGLPVPIGGPREHVLLAALLLEANRVVSSDRLIEALWGDHPPRDGRERPAGPRLKTQKDPDFFFSRR